MSGALQAVFQNQRSFVAPTNLYTWGENANGQLGLGNTTDKSSPNQVGSDTTWSTIAAGYAHAIVIKTDGTLWTWGRNNSGQLGDGIAYVVPTDKSSPIQVGALTTWASIAGGQFHTVAIKTDGKLWAWGRNSFGQLGLNNIVNYSSPMQVGGSGGLTDWLKVFSGYGHVMSVKTDGTLWAWGRNNYGQLGRGNTTNYSSPVQVGGLTTWLSMAGGIAHTIAVKTDGTLWTWGRGSSGQLGRGVLTNYSSPVQVGGLTTWLKVAAGGYYSLATQTGVSGGITIWTWGQNFYGSLGLNNTTYYSSPKQVGSLTTWLTIASGRYQIIAIKTDGKLWTWGRNDLGQLGLGNTTDKSSPNQIGSLTTWSTIAGGIQGSFTIARG